MGVGEEPPQITTRSVSVLRLFFSAIADIGAGFLYTSFTSQADYELVIDYAKQLDVVLWENAAKRCFFASAEGHETIKRFIQARTHGE